MLCDNPILSIAFVDKYSRIFIKEVALLVLPAFAMCRAERLETEDSPEL